MKYFLLSLVGVALLTIGILNLQEKAPASLEAPKTSQPTEKQIPSVSLPKARTSEFTRLAAQPVPPTEKVLKRIPQPCQPFIKKVLSFDAYDASKLTRSSLKPHQPDRLDEVRDRFTALVSKNECQLDSDHPLQKSHQQVVEHCTNLPRGLAPQNRERLASVFSCLNAVRNLRMQTVLLSYGDTPLKKIESLSALTVLFEASIEIQGLSGAPDRFARSREVAKEISDRLPESTEAATLLMQTSYIDLLTQGESPERLSRLEEAKKQLEAIDSSNARLAELRLNELLRQGQDAEAELMANEISQKLPKSDVGDYYRARIEYQKGNTEETLSLLESIAKKDPENIRARLTLFAIQNAEEFPAIDEAFIDENRTVAPREEIEETPKPEGEDSPA